MTLTPASAPGVRVIEATTTSTTIETTTSTPSEPRPLGSSNGDDDGPMWGGIAVVGLLVAVGAAAGYRLAQRPRSR